MQTRLLYWGPLCCITAGLLGCASSWGDAPLETAAAEERVLVTLQARDAEPTLTSTPQGVRYSSRDARGIGHAGLTLEQLQAVHPQLYELVRNATARAVVGGSDEGVLDASLGGLIFAAPLAGRLPPAASRSLQRE